jgi:hypothetical protein
MDNLQTQSSHTDSGAWKEWTLILVGLLCLVLTLAPTISADGAYRFTALQAMLGEPGNFRVKYSLVQPLLSIPLAWLAKLVGLPESNVVAYFNLLVFVVGGAYIYRLVSERYSPKVARISLLVLCCASMLPHHLQGYFGEVLTSVFLSMGALSIKRRPMLSVTMFTLGLANTPALIPPFAVVAFIYFWRKQGWQPLLAAVCALAIMGLENFVKFGSVHDVYLTKMEHGFHTVLPYSGTPGFSYPFFFGVLSIVASFGKGLVFYIPGALLYFVAPIWKRLGGSVLDRSLLAVFAGLVIAVYAKWWAWYGGKFWGPRFFLFLCFPASLLMALAIVHREQRRGLSAFVLVILLLSIWVGVDGYLFGLDAMDICWRDNFALESLCWYTPEFSALWRPFVTGDIDTAWGQPRAIFAFWQIFTGGYLIKQFLMPGHQRGVSSASAEHSEPTA